MARMLVIEGFDSSGKTTLVNAILEHFPEAVCLNRAREAKASESQCDWWQSPYFLTQTAREQLFVLDRCYATNICYGSMRGEETLHWHKQKQAFESLHDVLNIYVEPPLWVQSNAYADERIDLSAEQVACVCQAYRVLASCEGETIYCPREDLFATETILGRVHDHLQRTSVND